MNTVEVFPLFSTPVFLDNFGKIPDEIKDYVFNTEYDISGDKYGKLSLSRNNYILESPKLSWLKEKIIFSFENYVRNVLKVSKNINFKLMNSWATKCEPGERSERHNHSNSLISGVVYLQTIEGAGSIKFTRDVDLFSNLINIEYSEWNVFNSGGCKFDPKEGLTILFPSSLKHEITINSSNMTRYSIAFNFFPTGVFNNESNYGNLKINL